MAVPGHLLELTAVMFVARQHCTALETLGGNSETCCRCHANMREDLADMFSLTSAHTYVLLWLLLLLLLQQHQLPLKLCQR
jgi:hypothetical protein